MIVSEASLDFTNNFLSVFSGNNAEGKSTVFEAIALCLIDRKRSDTFSEYVKYGENSAILHLELLFNTDLMVIDLEIPSMTNRVVKKSISYKGLEYTNSECRTLLRDLDIDYLQHVLFSMQGESNITDMKPAQRTDLLKKIFKYDFVHQIEQVDTILNTNQINLNNFQIDLRTKKSLQYDEKTLIDISNIDIEDCILQLNALNQKKIELENILNTSSEDIESTKKELQTIINSLNLYTEKEIKLTNEINRLILIEDSMKGITKDFILFSIQKEEDAIKNFRDEIKRLEKIEVEFNKELSINIALFNKDKADLKLLESNNNSCPICKTELTNNNHKLHLEDAILNLRKKNESIQYKLLANTLEIAKANEIIEQSMKALNDYRLSLSKIESIVPLPSLESELDQNKVLITHFNDKKIELEKLVNTYKPVNTTKTQEELQKTLIQLKEYSRKIDLYNNTLAENNSIILYNNKMKDLTKIRDEAIAVLIDNIQRCEKQLTIYKVIKNILLNDLPNFIIVKACKILEQEINYFIKKFNPDMEVKLYQNKGGVQFFYKPIGLNNVEMINTKMSSGSEREVLSLAWRISLAKFYNLNILILDEIDSAGSDETSEKMFKEIANLEDVFNQIFIVTHKPEIIDILQKDVNRIKVYNVKKGNFSEIT